MSRLMFYGIFVQCLLMGVLMAKEGNGQSEKAKSIEEIFVTVQADGKRLIKVLSQIESQTDFSFSFHNQTVRGLKVYANGDRQSLGDLLRNLSSQTSLKFTRVNQNIGVSAIQNSKQVAVVKEVSLPEQVRISGQVTAAEDSEPLPGVSILIKGSSTGTTTDIDGNYSLSAPEGSVLQFSYIGFQTQEITVGNQSQLDIQLVADMAQLEEVVVVGYGTQKRQDLTGSVSSVSQKEIASLPTNTFEQALQGRVAGVQVTQGNAAPGGGISIRIRGTNSITGNSEPLYVIDGVPIISSNGSATVGGVGGEGGNRNDQNALASLNPNDIESIEILKDASAAAIYGSRGANGVIIVTTKRGKVGKPKVQFDAYAGVQEPVKKLDLIGVDEFVTQYVESYDNAGLPPGIDQNSLNILAAEGGFDYQEDLFRNTSEASIQNYQLSVSGASQDGMNYFISGGYFSQNGIVKETGFDRYSVRVNLDKTFGKFRFGNNLTMSRTNSDLIPTDGLSGVVSAAINMQPILPLFDEDGEFYFEDIEGGGINANPAAIIRGTEDQLQSDRVLGSIFAEYEFAEGLTFRTTLGIDIDKRFRRVYYNRLTGPRYGGTAQAGLAQQAQRQSTQVVSTNTLSYRKQFANKHSLNLTGVFETQTFEQNTISMVNRGFPSDALGVDAISSGQQEGGPNIGNGRFRWQLASWVARAFYSYDNRYLLTVTGRADGSSRFGENNRWGFFPSVAAGWRISEEAFMETASAIDELKLRVSWGMTGNQEIGILQTAERLNPTNAAVFGGVFVPSVVVASFANEDLKWEETSQFNIGLTSYLLNDRISFTADYYVKNTTDLLLAVNLPVSAGFTSRPIYNLGEIENKGLELALGADIISNDQVTWNVQANFTRNRNKVIDIFSDRIFGPQINAATKFPGNLVEEGRPVGVFFGYQTDGIFRTDQEAAESPVDQSDVYLQEGGEYRIVDTDGDGVITPDDRTMIGDPNPDFIYGFNSSLEWKGFTLDLNFQGVQGNDILWNEADNLIRNNRLQEFFDGRWTPNNQDASYPKPNQNTTQLASFYDSRLIYDGSFLRLRNMSLGYQLPVDQLGLTGISNFRIYTSITNLFTITDYPGYNPDVNSFGQSAINQGIDRGAYPLAKTYTLGVNLTF